MLRGNCEPYMNAGNFLKILADIFVYDSMCGPRGPRPSEYSMLTTGTPTLVDSEPQLWTAVVSSIREETAVFAGMNSTVHV